MERACDIAIVGGGLAGGLIALALARHKPGTRVRLFESREAPGGNHRWSWFASDLTAAGAGLLEPFPMTRWDSGYDVRFPGFTRTLATPYRSLASADFAAVLERELPGGTIRSGVHVTEFARDAVTLATGERITARAVIDCRGFAPTPHLTGGWQVFMGRHVRSAVPHGLDRPVIMDATVAQHDGYRFIYLLPLGPYDIFLEDTYYQDGPQLDPTLLAHRLDEYACTQRWHGDTLSTETGVLPVITGGDFAAFQQDRRIEGVAVAGARGGFVHPLTSYALPFAVETALAIAAAADRPGEQLAAMLEARARRHWNATRFYRRLGAMLFGAARPDARWRVFARFYRLDEGLVERFYAARSTLADRARILCGRPPVSLARAVGALARNQPPLQKAA